MDSKNQPSAINQAKAYGIDMALIEDNLERTPTERIIAHEAALETIIELQKAMKNAANNPSKITSKRY